MKTNTYKPTHTNKKMDRPKCEKCDSGFVYIRKEGTLVCRRCGHLTKPKKEVKK